MIKMQLFMEGITYFKMDKVFKIVERISYHTKIINLNVSYYIELNKRFQKLEK